MKAPKSIEFIKVEIKCVGCGHREWLNRDWLDLPGDVPMCSKCFSPCVAVKAST